MLFMSSIVLGIAALVAINSFGENLSTQIDGEAKELLGADLEVSSRTGIDDAVRERFDSLEFELAEEISFASMAYFPKNGGTRLVNIRAVEGNFPFYGALETEPALEETNWNQAKVALADQTLMLQFEATPGDTVKVGKLNFPIATKVIKVPGRSAIGTTVAPPVFIPLRLMPETGLSQLGSRMNYKIYARFPENFTLKELESLKSWLEKYELDIDDVGERKKSVGDAYSDLTGFLNLTAFVALILGCVGVAGSVNVYLKEKVQSIAVLRCLGASGLEAMSVYLIQVLGMGLIGSAVGAALGAFIQLYLPLLFADFLPFDVAISISWNAILQGIAIGVLAALLFSLFPLLRVRRVSPLKAIRASFERPETDRSRYIIYALILLFILWFSWLQLDSITRALIFSTGLLVAFGMLAGMSQAIIWLVRRYFPSGSSFVLRQSLANLYRPNNQTLILVVTIGLGTALIATLLISQELLVNKLKFSAAPESRPNMVLFDVQTSQVDSLKSLLLANDLPTMSEVPIVTMRLQSLEGRSVESIRADSTQKINERWLNREYRVSYRDTLSDSETLVSGRWSGAVMNSGDSIFISIEEGMAEDIGVGLGDELEFNVQGALMKTYVGSVRKIDWQRITTNFLVMFPEGVLEEAPKFHVLLTRFESTDQSAGFQSQVVSTFPNISIIDLELVLNTVDEVLAKVSFVIQFMAFFSIFTGILVLIGSVLISKYQRVQESVLLRTLGALRHHILKINTLEYFLLGSLAALSGIAIALIAGWLVAWLSFDTVLSPNLWMLLAVYGLITFLTVIIGLSNSREVVRKSPLEILRKVEG